MGWNTPVVNRFAAWPTRDHPLVQAIDMALRQAHLGTYYSVHLSKAENLAGQPALARYLCDHQFVALDPDTVQCVGCQMTAPLLHGERL